MQHYRKEQDRRGNIKFKILTVTDRIDEHKADYARDYLKIKEQALNEKRVIAIEKWQKEKILDTVDSWRWYQSSPTFQAVIAPH